MIASERHSSMCKSLFLSIMGLLMEVEVEHLDLDNLYFFLKIVKSEM